MNTALARSQPLPGMAVRQVWESRHNLTAEEHQVLALAKWLGWDELDEIAAPHVRDAEVKRGNLTVLGPRSHPLAYVLGPRLGLCLVGVGRHDATYGGWVRPGGEERPRSLTPEERAGDRQAAREYDARQRANDNILGWEARRGPRAAS